MVLYHFELLQGAKGVGGGERTGGRGGKKYEVAIMLITVH